MQINISKKIQTTNFYAFDEIRKRVNKLRDEGVEIIDFGVGNPTSPTPDFVINRLCNAAKERAGSGYPSYVGEKEFRNAVSNYLKREFNIILNPENEIISTVGSKEAIFNFPLGFIDQNDIVICPTPGYPPYKDGTKFAGGIPYFTPLIEENGFLIDFESIPDEICKKAKIIWVNYPNSPTGKTAPREWYEKLIKWAHLHNIIIAADEGCYIDIYFGEKTVSILEIAREGIIVFYSLSKRNNMAGYRVGFCAGDKNIIDIFKKVKTKIDSGTPMFIQDAAIVALEDTEHVKLMRKEYEHKRKILGEILMKTGLQDCRNDATFYIWQRVPNTMNGVEFANKLIELGIIVTPGEWISDITENGLNPGKDYVRFALVPTIEQTQEAVKKISNLQF